MICGSCVKKKCSYLSFRVQIHGEPCCEECLGDACTSLLYLSYYLVYFRRAPRFRGKEHGLDDVFPAKEIAFALG